MQAQRNRREGAKRQSNPTRRDFFSRVGDGLHGAALASLLSLHRDPNLGHHSDLDTALRYACGKTDQPIAALIKDLKRTGLLDQTLLVWGGEFGRLPLAQSREAGVTGRDHGPTGFTVWLAGAGVRGGVVHGATDEIGYKAVENRVSVHDLHATILHQIG